MAEAARGWGGGVGRWLSADPESALIKLQATAEMLPSVSTKPFRSLGVPAAKSAPAGAPVSSLGQLPCWVQRLVAALGRVAPEAVLLAGLAAVLNLWALSRNGYANDYYAAAVRSMSVSWHDFLFASMDKGGVMSVDKPPLALWVQALSARVFGYSSQSLLVPQALMGIISVLLIYDLVRRRFGRMGGFVAGLTLAVTPISVAVSRHNNPDALLILCCVAALWLGLRGLEDGRARWLVLAGVCVGLGFETKMLIALVVVPGLFAAWLWVAPRGRLAALRCLLLGGGAMVFLSGAWPALVELTPASARPWVSGTSDNRILSLIFGYNGLGRVDGQSGGPGGSPGGSVFGGTPGPLRLLNSALGGQAGWLLGFAVLGGIALLADTRLRRSDPRSGWLIAVGGSFAVTAAIFSYAKGIFHPYYVSLLAPFGAALVGAFAGRLAVAQRGQTWMRTASVAAIIAGLATELAVLHDYSGDLTWLWPLLVCTCVLAALAIVVSARAAILRLALAGALGTLLLGPAIWSFDTLGHAASGTFPAGGPVSAQTAAGAPGQAGGRLPALSAGAAVGGQPLFGAQAAAPGQQQEARAGQAVDPQRAEGPMQGQGPPPGAIAGGRGFGAARGGGPSAPLGGGAAGQQALTRAIAYVKSHGGGTLAVSSQSTAASAIVAADANVAGIGGFSGRESQITVSWLANEVRTGHIRWVLGEGSEQTGSRLPGDNRVGARVAIAAVRESCKRVDAGLSSESGAGEAASDELYDCAGRAAALRSHSSVTAS
jgi:4-amino-4-deoxy-L-arabinose transferase-like glycosyltransferase